MVDRKPVPKKLAARLVETGEAQRRALADRDAAIVEALRAGASNREVAKYVGLTAESVRKIGKHHGWPDPVIVEKQRQAKEAKEREEFRRFIEKHGRDL